jgi:hypothetical protein
VWGLPDPAEPRLILTEALEFGTASLYSILSPVLLVFVHDSSCGEV